MKKIIISIFLIILAAILLIPNTMYADDGGTVKYQAVLYSVYDVHSIDYEKDNGFREGVIVEILGIEIFNNVK